MKTEYITYSGQRFIASDLKEENIVIDDIAGALSKICRFNGHIDGFYSVAEHCMEVAEVLRKDKYDYAVQLCGLLHDAAEAYLGDIPTPVKRIMREYKIIEKQYQDIIFSKFGLTDTWNRVQSDIKRVDLYVLETEMETHELGRKSKNTAIIDFEFDFEAVRRSYIKKFNFLYAKFGE